MTLLECFNNERTKDCSIIVNYDNDYELVFSTSLEDVAIIEIPEDCIVELNNGIECYCIPYEDFLKNIWGIE